MKVLTLTRKARGKCLEFYDSDKAIQNAIMQQDYNPCEIALPFKVIELDKDRRFKNFQYKRGEYVPINMAIILISIVGYFAYSKGLLKK
tara:strand:- start:361 stop:627 length:267 start_codon:yes stop_codon:yes gene_type:complete